MGTSQTTQEDRVSEVNGEALQHELKHGVLTLRLCRPKANALNLELIASLQTALREAGRDSQVRCVLLTGSGNVFSAGQDVNEIQAARGQSIRGHLLQTYNPLILQIRQLEKPVLAAIQGTAAGAALGVALACDLRIAAAHASFVVGFLGIGLVPDSAVSLFLPALIGLGRATEYAFSNEPITAEQALTWGMINRIVPSAALDEEAHAWAQELAQGPRTAFALTKRAFNKAVYPHLEQVLDYEAHLQDIAGHTAEHQEGVQAFLEKRPPRYS